MKPLLALVKEGWDEKALAEQSASIAASFWQRL
jgi:hypothetical protein